MKVGFSLPHMGNIATVENIAYAARFGDTEGFDSLWVIDRILWPSEPQTPYPPSPDGSWPEVYQNVIDPIETLAYVAGITQNIKLATGIIDMLYQNPVILANRLAALDNLSKGRLQLGLGLGHSKDEFQAAGVPFENKGERADEFLQVLNKVWYDDVVEHKGKFYSIPKSVIGPKPYQEKIPIYLGGSAPKALDRIISSNANGWIGIPQLDLDAFKTGQEQLRKAAQEQGRDPQSIEFPVLLFPEVSESDLGADRLSMNGSIEQIAEDIQGFEKLGVNHVNLVFDFGTHSQDLKKRLGYAKQIRDAVIPSVFAKEVIQ
ncbi:MAG: TIGR03619 family F420-dependent LLM class oxidoreductase [Nitrosopumilus sp.]|nr:TIGR03619 family F420-dependent LLM class oxidoreductase [Nitrosopumilus sp.]NRA05217.1 TIGR03619 family F420-dependent LLM class oxidoreductase [Nitrosopumilus sp.]